MDTDYRISQFVTCTIGLFLIVAGFAGISNPEAQWFFGIVAFIGMILLLISSTLLPADINPNDDDHNFPVERGFSREGLLKGLFILTGISLSVIQSTSVNQIPIYKYLSSEIDGYMFFVIFFIMSSIYVKLIGRNGWYGLLGILGLIGFLIVAQLTPKKLLQT